jgi:hypothetical protein
MTPPKREQRLNPMSRRKGRPPAPPPGPEWMVLGITITCPECGWQGIEMTADAAVQMFEFHCRQLGHPEGTEPSTKEEQ